MWQSNPKIHEEFLDKQETNLEKKENFTGNVFSLCLFYIWPIHGYIWTTFVFLVFMILIILIIFVADQTKQFTSFKFSPLKIKYDLPPLTSIMV